MTFTPHQKELIKEVIVEVLQESPYLRYPIQKRWAKARFEEINGIERECECLK